MDGVGHLNNWLYFHQLTLRKGKVPGTASDTLCHVRAKQLGEGGLFQFPSTEDAKINVIQTQN